jgi:hypothetical protein
VQGVVGARPRPSHHLAVALGDDDQIAACDPAFDGAGVLLVSFEGRDAVGDALVEDRCDPFRIRGRGAPDDRVDFRLVGAQMS